MKTTMSALAALALVAATDLRAQETGSGNTVRLAGSKDAKVTLVYQHALPGIPGKSVRGVLVEYGPGGYSPSHTHAKSAFIYATVIEGEVRSKVSDGPEETYRTGENWTELPGDHHGVSANASETKPAKILAVFVVDDQDTVLTIPDQK
jgi:quercetin dioxygenase-like cupin family protein